MDVADVTSSLGVCSSRFVARGAGNPAALLTILFTLWVAAACGSPPDDQPDPLDGPALVSGSSLARYGLLVIPTQGGPAQFRAIGNPSSVRWTGRLNLGPVTSAYSLGSAAVLRRGERLQLYTTSPVEAVKRLPDAPRGARWIASATGGAFVANNRILALTATSASEITADGEVLWAAPAASGRVVALVEGSGGPELAVWESGDAAPAATRAVDTRGPVVLTGWGRQVVMASEEDRRLTAWSIPDLEPGDGMELDGPAVALATSPSQHRVFAASTDRPRFATIDRYAWREAGSSRVEAPFEALRPGITGDRLVAFDGSVAWSVTAGRTDPEPVPGEWRADLPLALPGTGVLVSTGDELGLVSEATGELEIVDGPVDAWWLPFRWGRRRPVAALAVAADDTMGDTDEALEAIADSVPFAFDRIGLLTMGTPPDRAPADLPIGDAPPGEDPPAASPAPELPGLPGGFYAVAVSSRELTTLGQIRQLLDGSGYSTHVLRRVDEANDTWYRLLVGPYTSRPDAEAVARELRRERGIDAWIHEEEGDRATGLRR